MPLHLIRHADAGNRSQWSGLDDMRPLSPAGHSQARQIADDLEATGVDLLLSSPLLRCRQTLEPLADRLGLQVTDHQTFAEGGYGNDALDAALTAASAHRAPAICSHGDVIPALIAAARRRGAHLTGPPSPAKGARYVCTVEGGDITHIVAVDAPPLTTEPAYLPDDQPG